MIGKELNHPFKCSFDPLFSPLKIVFLYFIKLYYIYIEDYVWKRSNLLKLKCHSLRTVWTFKALNRVNIPMYVRIEEKYTCVHICVYKRLNPLKSIMPFSKAVWISGWKTFGSSRCISCIEDYVRRMFNHSLEAQFLFSKRRSGTFLSPIEEARS